jgi:MFS family permease
VIALSLRELPSGRPEQRRPFDWLGMAVLAAILAALTFGLNQLDTADIARSLGSPLVWPFLLVSVLLLPLFWLIERPAIDPVLQIRLFQNRQVRLTAALASGAGLSEAAIVFLPALLVAAFGVAESTASFMLLPVVLAMAVGSPLSGRMLDRRGSRVVVVAGTALIGAGMLLVGLLTTTLVLFYLAAALFGLGLSVLLGASLRYIMLNEATLAERASAQAALTIFTSIGQLVGGALIGAVAASRGGGAAGYTTAFLLIGVVMIALMLAAFRLKGRADELATVQRNEAPGPIPAS